ncbi:hypothetical protein MTP99_009632 [Tenebrio molitor]|nr:hypothetical protein MTP99_009632 [Tenebrio molitor]
MKLSQHDNIPVGKIMTMITRDVNEFDISVLYSTTACCNSLRFLITCYVIYMEIGPSFAILLGLFCIIILMQVALANIFGSMKIKTLKKTDLSAIFGATVIGKRFLLLEQKKFPLYTRYTYCFLPNIPFRKPF